jgi:DUF1009 family protein
MDQPLTTEISTMERSDLKKMRIGLIAGSGQFPFLFLKAAKLKGYAVYGVCLRNEAHPDIARYAKEVDWLPLGQMERMIQFFKKHDVTEAVLMGAVNKTTMFSDVKPDMMAISILSKMEHTHDDAILRAFADGLASEGIAIKPSTEWLPELLAEKGVWTKRAPTDGEYADILLGHKIAKTIGELDIGQSVVVSGGTVLAVEAIDGTDATIVRGGKLAKQGAVVVKVSKPVQDLRFDVPAVGLETLKTMMSSHATVLAVEAGKTLVFDREEMIRMADQEQIAIVGVE